MYNQFHWGNMMANNAAHHPLAFLGLLGVFMAWAIVWKAFALYYAARDGKPWWFVALLFINTLGLLEILYIFVFRKRAPTCCPKCGCCEK